MSLYEEEFSRTLIIKLLMFKINNNSIHADNISRNPVRYNPYAYFPEVAIDFCSHANSPLLFNGIAISVEG
jgi:hypothetical protein